MNSSTARKHGDSSDGGGHLGARVVRMDGERKARGAAAYALDQHPEGMAHGVLLRATIGSGLTVSAEIDAASNSPGVLKVLTPFDTPPLNAAASFLDGSPGVGHHHIFPKEILYWGQPVAAVIAETRQQAEHAASLLRIGYDETVVTPDFHADNAGDGSPVDYLDINRGDADAAYEAAPIKVEAQYSTPREYHVPLEPHGAIAEWDGDRLTIREPSQWIDAMARTYADWFGIPFENMRLVSHYVGGGFGSKVLATTQAAVAGLSARMLGRPVKVAVTRAQTFTNSGGRAATRQTLQLGATLDGKLTAIIQDGATETSLHVPFAEQLNQATAVLYDVPNLRSRHRLFHVNTVTPGHMRAPGKHPSAFGIESAIDELAYAAGIDPLAIRLLNDAPHTNPETGQLWSSRRLREALLTGAERFGWDKRPMAPRSMSDGHVKIGWGVASGCFPALVQPGEAGIVIRDDGSVEVTSGAIDMGTGTYTILAQTAADALGVPLDSVSVQLGDSILPRAPMAGNSQLSSIMTGLVHQAGLSARDKIVGLALTEEGSPFRGLDVNTLEIRDGFIHPALDPSRAISVGDLLKATGHSRLEVLHDNFAAGMSKEEKHKTLTTVAGLDLPGQGVYSVLSWCAHFVEVRVDEDMGTVRVSRMVSAFDCGRLYNPKLAESQFKGGIIMGIGQALLEGGLVDPRDGRIVNDNFGDYLIPTNADIPDLDVISVGQPDEHASPMGGKPVGEIGIVGVTPAICNAVFHATGKRIRDIPLNIHRLLIED